MTIKVSNPSAVKYIENLALTAIIPSGWEIYNERLFSQDEPSHPQYSYNDIRDDRSIWYFDLPKGMTKTFRLRLRAAWKGSYTLPAVRCEAMYDPATNASSASLKANVL